ncbi:MAG: hypothetical protein E7562_04360 [Ruminococcaceae bacterium]|nr:hypothetical protein [Oscillospiraceae bacterium]
MKKILKTFISVITVLSLGFTISVSAVQQETGSTQTGEVPYQSYTYWVDYNSSEKTPVYSKPMYEVKNIVSAELLGADENSRLNDVTTDEYGNVYILDSGNSKIFVLDSNYNLIYTLQDIIYNDSKLVFTDAQGIFVDKNGVIYIADTENQRVVCMDKNGNVSRLLLLPESELIPTDFKYRPVKVAVDSKGYTYIASDGSYNGAILYSPQMEFLGFFGANTVKATASDVIKKLWDRLTSNDIKRAADEISLPFAFTDIVVGPDDFIYTTTGKGGKSVIQTGQICVLNPGGKDVLGDGDKNFADSKVGTYLFATLSQSLNNIDVDKDGFVYVLDTTYGRIFWYDSKSNLFSVFGGSAGIGEQKGTFSLPSAIAVNNGDVMVTDAKKNTLTVFGMTKFGKNVSDAQKITLSGDFASSLEIWESVITEDSNCQLAYRGIAKAYYDLGDNINAMEYARLGVDRETYADAFELRRTELIEENFYFVVLVIVILIVAVSLLVYFKRKKGIILIKNTKIKTVLSSVSHPVEAFRLVKEKGEGSLIISTVLLILFYVITVLNDTAGGFAFTIFDSENYNAVYVFLSTVGLVLLWSLSNWLVCTLAGGIGKLREIYIVTCYSLLPMIAARLCNLVLTHILVPDEGAFLGIMLTICTIYSLFMLIIGIMRIHDYEFGKFIGTTIFSVIGMLIIVFLLFLVFMLIQQVLTWVSTVFIEIRYR